MASTYTTNSGIEKPGSGEQSGTWGATVNTNMDIVDTLVSGFVQITATGTSETLTTTDGTVTNGMNRAIKYVDGGDLGGNCTVTFAPNDQEKLLFVENGLSASRSLIFSQGSGSNYTLQNGKQAIIRSDGAGSGAAVYGVLTNLEIATLEVTGVTTHGGNVVSDTDSTDDLGTTSVRWANLFVDGITATDEITATGFTGTLDGILGSGTAAAATVTQLTSGGNIVSDTDSTDDLGTTGVRWANLFVDGITATDEITATGFTGTLDGVLGGGSAAAASVTTLTTSGIASIDDTTESTSATTGSIHTDGGIGVAKAYVGTGAMKVSTATTIIPMNPIQSANHAAMYIQQTGGSAFNGSNGLGALHVAVSASATGDAVIIANAGDGTALTITNGVMSQDDTTDSTSTTSGSIHTDGGLGVAKDVFIGGDLATVTAGTSNLTLGVNAGDSIASGGNYNVCVGDEAGTAITTGDSNVAVGYSSMALNTIGGTNTAIGQQTLAANLESSGNVAVGYQAMLSNTSGTTNVAVGAYALDALLTTHYNTAIGYAAMGALVTGTFSTAVGYGALAGVTTGSQNTAVGYNALNACTGAGNTAIGDQALLLAAGANYNIAIGDHAGDSITTGGNNSCLGYYALSGCQGGVSNIGLGPNAGDAITTGSYNIMIGHNSDPSASGGANQIVIGDLNQVGKGNSTGFIAPSTGGVYQGNNATTWSYTSDRRIKKDIKPSEKGLEEINKLVPCTFFYKSDEELNEIPEFEGCHENLPQDVLTTSAIAQEVREVFPEAVTERNDYGMLSVNNDPITWAMVNAIKELSAEIDELKKWKEEHTCG